MSAKILIWDIENSAANGDFWGSTYNTNIVRVVRPQSTISFAAKWRGEKRVEFRSDFHDGHEAMIRRAWHLLDEADAVCSYNGARHDTPHAKTEILKADFAEVGMKVPSPYVELDLYKVVKTLKFQQNRLQFVLQDLGLGSKEDTGGFGLWVDCADGDPKAWAKMKRYNINDTIRTEALLERLWPHIPQRLLPNAGLYTDGGDCPRGCQPGAVLQKRGTVAVGMGLYQRYQCQSCGGWSRGKKSLAMAEQRGI